MLGVWHGGHAGDRWKHLSGLEVSRSVMRRTWLVCWHSLLHLNRARHTGWLLALCDSCDGAAMSRALQHGQGSV